jgi:RNA polymerase sigma factor (TIGR02999 family)
MGEVTRMLSEIERGERTTEELLPLVYDELRRLAAFKLGQIPPGQTLQPTALVHEAYLRLVGDLDPRWETRGHFFAAAAEAMRRILVESARRKGARRHGGGQHRVDIDQVEVAAAEKEEEMLAVHEVLELFAARDPQKAELVKLRYFVGMTLEEAAEVLGISATMAKRHWAYARAWLLREIRRQDGSP